MDSHKTTYTAEYFKKDKPSETGRNDEYTEADTSRSEDSDISNKKSDISNKGSDIPSEGDIAETFMNEDGEISKLYREVVDHMKDKHNLRESTVNAAIKNMKQEICQLYKKGIERFLGINFCKVENRCGYLRRYAICYTGLVRKIMHTFFVEERTDHVKEIINAKHLTIVSLGGGPGNDLVGFCTALHKIPNKIENFKLIIVDNYKEWEDVFPEILRKAKESGKLTEFIQTPKTLDFIAKDLTENEVFKDEKLSLALQEADIILMVKLISFLQKSNKNEALDLIRNVVNAMNSEAKLIIIDKTSYKNLLKKIENLNIIYNKYHKYDLSFTPKKGQSVSITSSEAYVHICKKIISSEDSSRK